MCYTSLKSSRLKEIYLRGSLKGKDYSSIGGVKEEIKPLGCVDSPWFSFNSVGGWLKWMLWHFLRSFVSIVNLKNPSMLLLALSSLLGEIGLESACQPHGIWSQHV